MKRSHYIIVFVKYGVLAQHFKPVVAGIGLKTESIDPKEDFGNEGLAWQKDSSWGSYQVTTLHEYEPVIMKNAIIYSDNIYFAKAALKKLVVRIFMNTLNEIGFNQNMPFEMRCRNQHIPIQIK
mgnify:CR=1 FL=1